MTSDPDTIIRFLAGNLSYSLLIISMMMTRMLWLRLFGVAAGITGTAYSFFWLNDPVFTFWDGAFTVVNIAQLVLMSYRNVSARLNADERVFYELVVPTLEPRQVRNILRIGSWLQAETGAELIRQGEPVSHLLFLKSGRASVLVNNKSVSYCTSGSLLGEISIFNGEPATATVVATEPVHYLALEGTALHKFMEGDPEIASALNSANRKELGNKLVRMNALVSGNT